MATPLTARSRLMDGGRPAAAPTAGLRVALPAALTAAFTAALVACGGGGGGSSASSVTAPPSTGATLTNSSTDASQSAQAVVAGAGAAAARVGSMSGVSAVFGAPVGTQSATRAHALGAPSEAAPGAAAAQRKRALAVATLGCAELVDPPCTGSATSDTNITANATGIVPGNYFDLQFAALSGSLFGKSVVLNGHMRIEFLSALAFNATTFPGLDLQILLDGFNGSVGGVPFGPTSDLARLQINAQGLSTVTAAGITYIGLNTVTLSGNGNYSVGDATLRLSHWSEPSRYVELHLVNWTVTSGRPGVGSTATVSAAVGSIAINVTSTSSTNVVYAVGITAGNATTPYIVTATYPAGGGAPSYGVVPG